MERSTPKRIFGLALLPFAVPLAHGGVRADVSAAFSLIVEADIALLRDHLLDYGWWAPVVSTVLQIVTSIIAPLPSFMLSFVNAMLYGIWWGAALTLSSAMVAAAICFWISRRFGRPAVERFVPAGALASADLFFARHGALAVLFGRIVPFINPDVVSYAAGLTRMRWKIFLISIAIGSLPSTALYSYLGSRGFTTVGWLFGPLIGVSIAVAALTLIHRVRSAEGLARG